MKAYTIAQDYHSGICEALTLGRLVAGGTVELDEAVAAAINADSPGTLTEDKPAARQQPAAKNRQVKKASKDR